MLTANDLLAGRVLAFTQAEAILADVNAAVDLLGESLTTHINDHDEKLADVIDGLLKKARDQWLERPGGEMGEGTYNWHRAAVIGRARSIERRANAAAAAAARLAELFEFAEHYDTEADLISLVDTIAGRLSTAGAGYANPAEACEAMTQAWARIKSSRLVEFAAAERVRRHFDANLNVKPHPALAAEVDTWREHHLKGATWDAPTWAYAVASCRTWDEARNLWDTLGDADRRGPITPTDNMRLRTALAATVTEHIALVAEAVPTLVEDVNQFNTGTTSLAMRIRFAETMADLAVIMEILTATDLRTEGTLNLSRALARKWDDLSDKAPDADPEYGTVGGDVANAVNAFRHHLYTTALASTVSRGAVDYTEPQRYTLMYNALADAVDTGWPEHVDALMSHIDRVAEANAEHILTAEHIDRLRGLVAPTNTAPITIATGGTH